MRMRSPQAFRLTACCRCLLIVFSCLLKGSFSPCAMAVARCCSVRRAIDASSGGETGAIGDCTMTTPERQGLYDPVREHDACGVGFVVHSKGVKSHDIIRQGLQILVNLEHRGAVGA